MAGLKKSECSEIMDFLLGKIKDEDLPRVKILLERNVESGAQDDDLPSAAMYGLDGRRLVRPASHKDRKSFEEKHGITPRRIRNLGA
jgi:hypothetical protein